MAGNLQPTRFESFHCFLTRDFRLNIKHQGDDIMRCSHYLSLSLVLAAAAALAGTAKAAALPVCSYGHTHAGVDYDDATQTLNLHFASEGAIIDGVETWGPGGVGTEAEFAPEDIVILVPSTTQQTAPTGAAYAGWSFLGVPPGGTYYRLSHDPVACYTTEKTPYFGFAAEEIATGVFQDDLLTFSLKSVQAAPPGGEVSVYLPPTDVNPTVFMTSVGSTFPNGELQIPAGDHGHFDLGFSKPGYYQVEYAVSGQLANGGATVSDSAVFNFQVAPEPVPEPGALALLGGAAVALAIAAARRRARRIL
jgi:surface-anchored protein